MVRATSPAASGTAGLLRQALLEPLLDFLSRPGAWTILAFVALFKLGEAMASHLGTAVPETGKVRTLGELVQHLTKDI